MQLFGDLVFPNGKRHLMLCKDIDRPNEVILHYIDFSDVNRSGAVLFDADIQDTRIDLRPRTLYTVADNGKTLYPPPSLDAEQLNWMGALRASLQISKTGLEGGVQGPGNFQANVILKEGIPLQGGPLAVDTLNSWGEFKDWVAIMRREMDAASFRGHGSNKFRLRTSFHRAGLQRIERFVAGNGLLASFKAHAEAVLNERFNTNDGEEFATLLGLAQHHGLPTPMLDWTGSPYIAAFFAFADYVQEAASRSHVEYVRIFALARTFIELNSPALVNLAQVRPYVECLQVAPRKNPRLYAQRGQFLVTNVDDLETFLLAIEQHTGGKILRCADLPVKCASDALEDLEFMGLSAAALFPGLDGICRMLRHQINYRRPPLKLKTEEISSPVAPQRPK